MVMKRPFSASIWRKGDWYVSQCLDVDVTSQDESEEGALANLREALELHFEEPQASRPSKVRTIEVEVGAGYPPLLLRQEPFHGVPWINARKHSWVTSSATSDDPAKR
jgi:predicted RNase H-like HicB family nuclease